MSAAEVLARAEEADVVTSAQAAARLLASNLTAWLAAPSTAFAVSRSDVEIDQSGVQAAIELLEAAALRPEPSVKEALAATRQAIAHDNLLALLRLKDERILARS